MKSLGSNALGVTFKREGSKNQSGWFHLKHKNRNEYGSFITSCSDPFKGILTKLASTHFLSSILRAHGKQNQQRSHAISQPLIQETGPSEHPAINSGPERS